ncbi:cytochrome oxidase assembly protein ShyY1 [Isoptericola sp. CG 20/1183]|uniref:SURF1-like protein n=1 Tax=Isoptericola halotolerans TaxID=300560 RepID=A0ABX5EB86_9MICO|nr:MULTISPECIES: SURF1 family protein [Isoptericola]MCK0115907.1 SURF1 family protein [Isoptericola sp. S6320L]PRZ02552.1 cytochrome oxidase assembly protein ShyY1 [Isoptericola sp. CG 20/1183]PRZ02833.1 cytochrome oxidase assembly protein ShyY1 [Isoptericola halotolerans]
MKRTRRQWVTLGLAAVLLAALCVLAAFWQWHRYTDRQEQIDLVDANYAAQPVPLEELVAGPGSTLAADDVWRPAVVVGEYVPEDTVLLRNRPVNGTPGFHLLVPLRTELGGEPVVIVVDRGFVPLGADASEAASVPDPPAGQVAVTVTLRADEPAADRGAEGGTVSRINTEQVLAATQGASTADGGTVGAYGQMRSEDPAADQALVPAPRPDTDPGSHLSYTFQWAIFALGAVGGFVLLWRRETRAATVTAGELIAAEEPEGSSRPRRERRRPRRVDEEHEDALVDAARPGHRG